MRWLLSLYSDPTLISPQVVDRAQTFASFDGCYKCVPQRLRFSGFPPTFCVLYKFTYLLTYLKLGGAGNVCKGPFYEIRGP